MRKVGVILLAIGAIATGYYIGYSDCKMRVAENLIDCLTSDKTKEEVTKATVDAATKIVK